LLVVTDPTLQMRQLFGAEVSGGWLHVVYT